MTVLSAQGCCSQRTDGCDTALATELPLHSRRPAPSYRCAQDELTRWRPGLDQAVKAPEAEVRVALRGRRCAVVEAEVVPGGGHLDAALPGVGERRRDRSPGVRVAVEEGAGHSCPSGDGGDADLGLLPPEAGNRVVDALEGGLGCAMAGGHQKIQVGGHSFPIGGQFGSRWAASLSVTVSAGWGEKSNCRADCGARA